MAETLISPGVFLNENDQSQITQGPLAAGAALLGPTVIGPVNIPTVVTSYSQYKAIFGSTFVSGGLTTEYLTSVAALNYFNQGGNSLLVTRVASGSYTSATASVPSTGYTNVPGTRASASYTPVAADTASWSTILLNYVTPFGNVDYQIFNSPWRVTGSIEDYGSQILIGVGNGVNFSNVVSSVATWAGYVVNAINTSTKDIGRTFTASYAGGILTISAKTAGVDGNNFQLTSSWNNGFQASTYIQFVGGTNAINAASFELETLSVGSVMNNATASATQGLLPSGSNINVRWEVVASSSGSGTFTINVRRGDDYNNSKTILESWSNLSLDPNQNNFISYVIGDQKDTVATDGTTYYIQPQGNYPNKSKYIRVKSVNLPTPNYFDTNGTPQPQFTGSLPQIGSGSLNGGFTGAVGTIWGSFGIANLNLFENIPNVAASTNSNNTQGLLASNYDTAIALLGNKDAYDFNVVYTPGLTSVNAPAQIASLIQLSQDRGDNISVIDMVGYGQSLNTVVSQATAYDNSYAATYWPWIQIRSAETGRLNFVPPSTIVPAIYEYNDKVAAEWWAPAGINRGGMSTVLQPERKLTINDRNTLYAGKVNPIANFAGVGTVIYGQKTLQSKSSALDRVNVRRLLIALKRYIGQIGETLVFEPNTQVTRNKFLNQVNPYLETVQQKQGLYSFQVVMDETNNTPDTIDRNILIGSIYLQPTRVAEFIQLDFNILPTGTTFGQ